MSASEHLLSRIRAHIPAGYWRVLSVYRVAHGGATSAAVRRPVCSLPMVVTGSLALGMDGGGHRHAGPPHAPATRGLVLPRSRLPVGSTRDAHLVRRAAARRADRRAGGWALALLARTKVRSPARPRARHPAPCPAPRSPCPRAPLSALARRSRYSPCPPVPVAGARRPRPPAPRMPGRGAGAARARASQAGWCFCGDLAACEAAAAAESPAAAAISLPPCACACARVCVTSQKCFSCLQLTHTRALGRAGGRAGAFRPPVVIIFYQSPPTYSAICSGSTSQLSTSRFFSRSDVSRPVLPVGLTGLLGARRGV